MQVQKKEHVLFIGNIPIGIDKEDIRKILKARGDINQIQITNPVKKNQPKATGYGYGR